MTQHSNLTRPGLSPFAIAVVTVLCLALAIYAFAKPKYGWDVTNYVGCTFHALDLIDGTASWPETHAKTYTYLEATFPEAIYREMTTSPPGISPYRSIIATDPEAFRQRLSASCYKLGFIAPVITLAAIGVDPFMATRIVAVVPATLFFGLALLWMSKRAPPLIVLPLGLLGALTGLLQTARYEYPDGMTALFIGAALMAFSENRSRIAACLFLATIVVRADAILYFGMFLAYATFLADPSRRLPFRTSFWFGLAALALYESIALAMTTPSFQAAFYHSFIANMPYLLGEHPHLTLSMYLEVLTREIGVVASKSAKYPALIAMALATALLARGHHALNEYRDVAVVALLMVSFHFLFIPWFDTRYYAAPYLLIMVCFGLALYGRFVYYKTRVKS